MIRKVVLVLLTIRQSEMKRWQRVSIQKLGQITLGRKVLKSHHSHTACRIDQDINIFAYVSEEAVDLFRLADIYLQK